MTEITKYFRTESSNKTKFELVWPGVSPDNTGNIYNGLQLSPEIKKTRDTPSQKFAIFYS